MDVVEFSQIFVTISEQQQRELWAIARQNGISQDQVREIINSYGYAMTKEISVTHYGGIIAALS